MPRLQPGALNPRAFRNGTGETAGGHACGITSAPAERASPQDLLAWNRGHRAVEATRHVRDTVFGEDACLARTGFAPGNNATATNLALAVILHRTGSAGIASAARRFALRRRDAFAAILSS